MRLIIDTDPGIDDALALLYLAAQPGVEIAAVGSVHGNAPAPRTAANARRVLDEAGLRDVPVAVGAHRPLAQPLRTSEFVHGDDGLGGEGGDVDVTRGESAAEQLVRLARANPGRFTLLALGPLTNVALALLLEPDLPDLLDAVVVMGGAIRVPGNRTAHAEANVHLDPEAADLVLGAGFRLTLVGLDVTEAVRVDSAWIDALNASPAPVARFSAAALRYYVDFYTKALGYRTFTPHDPLAAAILLDPTLATYDHLAVGVELTGTHTRGRTVADLRGNRAEGTGHRIAVARTVDTARFHSGLLAALTR
ncbi:nucleoside hydrolase [Actinokineospora auranticolor]|uniref:Purine nucleosidase n=1 Tax=Actinokineospora auranticolor TaxID=155976 RepID=A0A2S6GJT0_9PSEU|nr:nucleoside hydrolase [Actinokineospora auranticolor]PPK65477.1 purine nucleosidase [Actinokineospora auranticolor]